MKISSRVGYGEGVPGSQDHYVPVTARHDLPIHGFSRALSYPRSSLRLLEISARGTATEGVHAALGDRR